ncbi:hypothetical protein BD309DRAFT_579654 [Dichomitus squalens]|uniref:Uncharacterized protein n=1 Tax=Dichomitus squalens TaxID=114155 RepID=A0A4Q9P8L3_9APHY|nr:uncharacterized protein DICSQDRAFT_154379 [Dichomitus squalens LYAD-421 SS1]EJF62494.1 hypothetical protein DICSQDRAFT_154379 [Dichomitus squalens LYAD-421 SS1]TBU50175.1 hypothetical protein BD309DRAFT_579654 [Dichomitus squalens]TBU66196.1 hypothetical protein BD310DRAFT_912947 [Dichomitus squalens]
MNVPQTYTGLLGSEGTRFPGQRTTDIHYFNYLPPGVDPKLRQRATAIAQSITFLIPQIRVAFHPDVDGWPLHEVWVDLPVWIWCLYVWNEGPSQPGWQPPWPGRIREPAMFGWIGGQWRLGYCVRWFHETVEYQSLPHRGPRLLWYHEHERRGEDEHQVDLRIVKDGKHCQIENLRFGTQLQVYRRAVED